MFQDTDSRMCPISQRQFVLGQGVAFEAAVLPHRMCSLTIECVLYDSSYSGKESRLKQQYFLVAATMHDILARYKKTGHPIQELYIMTVP